MKRVLFILLLSFGLFGCSSSSKNLEAVTDNVVEIYTSRHSPDQFSPIVVDYIEKNAEDKIRDVMAGFLEAYKSFDLEEIKEYMANPGRLTEYFSIYYISMDEFKKIAENYGLTEEEKEQLQEAADLFKELMQVYFEKGTGSFEMEEISVNGVQAQAVMEGSILDADAFDIKDIISRLWEYQLDPNTNETQALCSILQERIHFLRDFDFPMKTIQVSTTLEFAGKDWKIEDSTLFYEDNVLNS